MATPRKHRECVIVPVFGPCGAVPPGSVGQGPEQSRGPREAQCSGQTVERHAEANRVLPQTAVQETAQEGEFLRGSDRGSGSSARLAEAHCPRALVNGACTFLHPVASVAYECPHVHRLTAPERS